MNPITLDAWLGVAANIIRLVAGIAKWKGGEKLSTELQAVADKTDAFRSDPVMKEEIDAARLSHIWTPPASPGS